ncbi:hypothetical protein ACZ91_38355 [Streptomyces regensis]|nr:hypothetical protein ACZ91_38355 [Streptomyces regensis]
MDKERTLPRAELLHEAAEVITGDRNKSYGEPTANFDNTARVWTAQLGHKLKDGAEFTASDVAQLMIGLKLARLVADPKRDTWLDIAGYAGCGWETVEGEAS